MLVLGPGPKRGRGVGREGINEALGKGKVTMGEGWQCYANLFSLQTLILPKIKSTYFVSRSKTEN